MGKRRLEEGEQRCSNVFVSFSKRRKGLFQKASELCIKCGAQVAIVVLSPTGNPFAFGHASVDEVLHHYLCQTAINPSCFITDEHKHQNQIIEHKHQNQIIEGLKFSLKQEQKRDPLDEESKVVLGLKQWIEKEFEHCKTTTAVEDLEGLKQKFVVFVDQITRRILGFGSSTSSVEKGKDVAITNYECGSTPFDEEDFGISLSDLWS
ncbi:agamous-like MADS-box protein AGL62 [Humulus lupulus]|uniref:agamous-like MADS-box protein AGL62 n=1 Tax=Humulus lupulus TaxID=3486 RepID=UPI002B401B75|nr:agamous-like MADS-box protein AGL62 [Humulus lupulus]